MSGCCKRRGYILTIVLTFVYLGPAFFYISHLKSIVDIPIDNVKKKLVSIQSRSIKEPEPYVDPDRNKEEGVAFQIREIFKSVKDGQTLLEQYKKEGKLKLIPDALEPEQKQRVRTEKKKVTSGPEFKNEAVGYPTSNAPLYLANLETPWTIADVLMKPWKVQEIIDSSNIQNDGCFRAPAERKKWKMITVVKSWVVNSENRRAIRDTWASVHLIDSVELETIFLVARAETPKQQEALKKENDEFGDILQVDIKEEVQQFTARTIAGMKWVAENIPSNYLYSSCDDNMIANIDLLTQALNTSVNAAPKVWGSTCRVSDIFPLYCVYSFREADKPVREPDNPWSMTEEDYPPEVLPGHCQGGFYTSAVSTVKLLIGTAVKTKLSHLDAMWITGIVRQKLGMDWRSVKAAPAIETPGDYSAFFDKDIAQNIRKEWERIVRRSEKLTKIFS